MTTHEQELSRLRKIEGQIRGVQRMIEQQRYCIDILTQLTSIVGAITSVEENILDRHLKHCVQDSFLKGSLEERKTKAGEVIHFLKRFRKY
jgi:DNA-binding FrmR family transcriptional regulator